MLGSVTTYNFAMSAMSVEEKEMVSFIEML